MAEPEKMEAETGEGDNDQEFEAEGDEENTANELTTQLMKNPEVLAALQSRLGHIVGSPSGYIASLPKVVKRRIKALKKLQLEATKIEAQFYEEVHALECKYANLYSPLYEKRKLVTVGTHEPTDEESEWPSDDEKEEENQLSEELKAKVAIEGTKENKENEKKVEENPTGIPEFWLTLFKNVDMLAEMVQEYDEPILKHLVDVKVQFTQSNPMGFKLEFYFDANEYFTNTVLTKEYEMKCAPDDNDPFAFEGPEIVKCKGCTIDWKKGKNITVKTVKKKQKHKSRGSVRTITTTVKNDSFFNYFSPPSVPEDANEVDEDTQALLAADFEIGHFIRERIIPRAVLYFTGEALDDDDFDEEEGEEEGDDDDEDDDENDPDFNPQNEKLKKASQNPSECKQQ